MAHNNIYTHEKDQFSNHYMYEAKTREPKRERTHCPKLVYYIWNLWNHKKKIINNSRSNLRIQTQEGERPNSVRSGEEIDIS